jgi:nucleotide-binding universal stress UspA family protein
MYGQILVGIDGSEGSLRALRWTVEEAARRNSRVRAVTVWQSPLDTDDAFGSHVDEVKMLDEAKARLTHALTEVVCNYPEVLIEPLVLEGEPVATLCEQAQRADLLVVGSRGHSALGALLLGSVSSKCAHQSPCPIVIVPKQTGKEAAPGVTGRIVVGVEGSAGSRRALAWAIEEAVARHDVIEAVSVWRGTDPDDDMELELRTFPSIQQHEAAMAETAKERLDRAIAEVAGESPVAVIEPLVLEGDPATSLCERAARADLLVVGSRSHGALAGHLLGSVSSKCAQHSPRPIVIVPKDEAGTRATDRVQM